MADEHRREQQRKMEESFESPNADESKIVRAKKYDLKGEVETDNVLQKSGQQISQLDQASKQLKQMALQAQEETKGHPKAPKIALVGGDVHKASLFRNPPQKVRQTMKDLNRQLDEANVEIGDNTSHNLEGQDSYSETVSRVSERQSIEFSVNSGYYIDNQQDMAEKQAYFDLVNQDRKLTPSDNGVVMPRTSPP